MGYLGLGINFYCCSLGRSRLLLLNLLTPVRVDEFQ
jgi:hypothetical protein